MKTIALLFVGLWALVNIPAPVWAFASSPRIALQATLWATLLNPSAHLAVEHICTGFTLINLSL